jgi:hypothetical protein
MADPLHGLIEITEGIFEIWSKIGNFRENVTIFDPFLKGKFTQKLVKNLNFS